jgi:hypothetical protein
MLSDAKFPWFVAHDLMDYATSGSIVIALGIRRLKER